MRSPFPPLRVGRTINAPRATVWRLLVDTTLWPKWGPSVATVQCPECCDGIIELGVQGKVKTTVGVWLSFEVIEMIPQRYWLWKVAGVRATGHRVTPLGNDRCRVVFEVPRSAFFYVPVCLVAARRIGRMALQMIEV